MHNKVFIPPIDLNTISCFNKHNTEAKKYNEQETLIAKESNPSKIFKFSADNPVEKPNAIIGIGNHVLATKGNIMTIAGQAKAGKSGVVSATLAGALAILGDVVDTLGFRIERNNEEKALIHIDSEQSRYDHYRSMLQVLKRVSRSKEPNWFYSYNFQLLSITERSKALKEQCGALAIKHGGIHMIVIDGGADFVLDTNDQKESNDMVQFFSGLAIEFDCPVVVVLHFNPGSEKGRGHFGSQLERKSESVISVTKESESEISTIDGKFLRNSGSIPKLQFVYDQEKGHHVYYGIKIRTNSQELKLDKFRKLVNEIFSNTSESLSYTEMWNKIMALADVKERAAKNLIKIMVELMLIGKNNDERYQLVPTNNERSV